MLPPAVEAVASLGVALLIALATLLVGYRCVPRRWMPGECRLAVPFALSAGALVAGTLLWTAGATLGTRVALVAFALLATFSATELPRARRDVRRLARRGRSLARHQPLGAALVAASFALAIPAALLPVSDSDGLRYHLAYPKLFLLAGRVFYYRWDLTGALPQGGDMLFLVALAAKAPLAAKLLHVLFFGGTLAVLALAVHRGRRTRGAALAAPLLFALSPVVLAPAGAAFVDHLAGFHLAVALLLVVSRRRALLVGIALAAALTTKLTGAPAAAGIAIACLVRSPVRGVPRGLARRLAEVALPALLALAPLAIRNARETGDPLYPVGYTLLRRPIPGLPAASERYVTAFHSKEAGPLGIAWGGASDVQPDEVAGWHHLAGLFAIAVVLVEKAASPFLAPLLPFLFAGLVFHPPTRLAMPMLLGLAGLEAVALGRLLGRRAILGALVLAAPAIPDVVRVVAPPRDVARALASRSGREDFLRSNVPGYRAAALLNAQPPGGVVMALDFPAPFYLDRPWIGEETINEPALKTWLDEGASAEEMLRRLHALDVRWILVTPGYGGGTPLSLLRVASTPERAAPLVQLRSRLRLVGTVDGVDLYEVPHDGAGGRSAGQE